MNMILMMGREYTEKGAVIREPLLSDVQSELRGNLSKGVVESAVLLSERPHLVVTALK